MSLPHELKLRKDRLAAMSAAKAEIAARAAERYARGKAEFDEKMSKREKREKETGKKPRGKTPFVPEPGAKDTGQINLTDEESRIMPPCQGVALSSATTHKPESMLTQCWSWRLL